MSKSYVLPSKKKFIPLEPLPQFRVSFRYKCDDFPGDYAAIFSIPGHDENLVFSADSKDVLLRMMGFFTIFCADSMQHLSSIPLGELVPWGEFCREL